MGKAKPVALDTGVYRTQGQCTAFYSAMLQRYKIGERVNEVDEPHLRALIKRHTEYPEKFVPGVEYFFVDLPGDPDDKPKLRDPGKCFWFHPTEGDDDDFSIGNCITQIARG